MKWTKKSIDNFYLENKVILTINNDLINHREIKKLGNKYYNWYQAIVRDYNDSYENVEDFRITHGLVKEIKKKYTKNIIDDIYNKHIDKIVKDNKLITANQLKEYSNELYGWYQAITRGNSGYKNMNDFKEKNGLSLPKATYRWTKKSLEKFYMENKLILTSGRYLLPYTKIESYGPEFSSWFKNISSKKKGFYNDLDHFKRKHKLIKGRTKSFKSL